MNCKYPARVSDNRRFLLDQKDAPFFWLGDTAWELFHRLDRDETQYYLQKRAAQGFTVIQAVVFAELDGLRVPNRDGEVPLVDFDPTKPNQKYFAHVDWVLQRANELGLCIGVLPTWGDKWNQKWGAGPEIFTPENATIYGEWLGLRYRDAGIVWIVGGDRPIENETHRAIVENMASGLRRGDGGAHLITFHPCGQQTSSQYFHESNWLDFNMWQTGHRRGRDSYNSIAHDYLLTPPKPCLDGEPGYEDHASDFQLKNGYLNDYDVRRSLYWALFAGACGHTYGCHPIWQMWEPGREPITWVRRSWREALDLPGGSQMQHARKLLESRAILTRIPDQSLILSDNPDGDAHHVATRDEEGSYALVYFPTSTPAQIDLSKIGSENVRASWFDPRTGETLRAGEYSGHEAEFTPPADEDWVLLLGSSDLQN